MKKRDQLLQALLETPSLTADELADRLGWDEKTTGAMLSWLKTNGKVVAERVGDERRARFKAVAGEPAEQTETPTLATITKLITPAPLTAGEVARKHLPKVNGNGNGNGASLIQRHVGTTLETLESLLDIGECGPGVVSALKAHKEALELAMGGHG